MKYSTFAVTIRPLEGITDSHLSLFVSWCQKHAKYFAIVTEMEGTDRHIHAGIWLPEPKLRSNLSTMLLRLFPDFSDSEKKVLQSGIKIMYNMDFVQKYMTKDEDVVEVESRLPETGGPGYLESYFPPLPSKKIRTSVDPFYRNLESLWYEHVPKDFHITPSNCRNFLFDMVYAKRLIKVIRDDKQIFQISKHLSRYLTKATISTLQLAPFDVDE